ncbi:MAG: hypothetical protein HY883_06210, partial [Deltaproteobacteria bacterium]|nr:hypothetical protein [Deltaproteobacteria bacterium]
MIKESALLAMGVGTFVLPGIILLQYVDKGGKADFDWPLRLALSFMLGLGIVSLQMFFYSLLHIPFNIWSIMPPWIFLAALILLSPIGERAAAMCPAMMNPPPPGDSNWPYTAFLSAVVISQASYIFFHALLTPISAWDA